MRETAPEAAEAPQVGDTERELEGDERAAEEERRLVQAQGLRVVDEGAVVRLRVPEAAGLPARPARKLSRTSSETARAASAAKSGSSFPVPPKTPIVV